MGASEFALSALAFVLTYAIHSTLLLGVACLLAPRIVRSLALREKLWKTAMFGGLLTSLVQVGASMETPLFHWTLESHSEASSLAADNQLELERAPQLQLELALAPATTDASDGASEPAAADGARTELCVEDGASTNVSSPAQVRAKVASAAPAPRVSPIVSAAPTERDLAANPVRESDSAHENELAGAAAREADAPSASIEREDSESWSAALVRGWRTWTARGLALWAVFACAVLVVFASMCLRLVRCMRGRTELESGELRDVLDRLVRQAYPAGRRVRLYVAPELRAPVSLGWLRPAICVPPRALVELSADEQESMLAHELAHLVRRDPLWLSAAWLVERVFFFQPLHRVARAELHDLAELACDEWAARRTGDRLALASCLARIAEWIIAAPRALPATSMAEHHGRCRLTQRIERLLDDEAGLARDERTRRWLAPAMATGLGALVFVAPGVSAPATTTDASVFDHAQVDSPEFDASAEERAPAPLRTTTDASWVPAAPSNAGRPAAASPSELDSAAPREFAAQLDLADSALDAPTPPAAPTPTLATLPAPTVDERASLNAQLDQLNASLSALRAELGPLRDEVGDLGRDSQVARALSAIARRIDNLERRSQSLQQVIQVLETLESKPAHPSSTSVGFQGSRSLP